MMSASMTDPYSLRHQAQRAAGDADQAEFFALKNGSTVIDIGIYDERVAGAMDDFDPMDGADRASWHEEDLKYDSAVGNILAEIERRTQFMGSAYPFTVSGGTIKYTPQKHPVYEFLLSICNAATLTTGEFVQLPRLFERLSARLVAAYFGSNTRFIHTGAPRDPEIGSSFRNAMQTVAKQTGEWTWGPDEGLPNEPWQGDAGCDFIVWPKPPDGRKIGQLFLLGQCACGNDWSTKFYDLTVSNLRKWFNPLSTVDPVRCFTTPHHVTDAMLEDASRQAGVIFDRARLVSICKDLPDTDFEKQMRTDMVKLIDLTQK